MHVQLQWQASRRCAAPAEVPTKTYYTACWQQLLLLLGTKSID
jgi:hypothetical protein